MVLVVVAVVVVRMRVSDECVFFWCPFGGWARGEINGFL